MLRRFVLAVAALGTLAVVAPNPPAVAPTPAPTVHLSEIDALGAPITSTSTSAYKFSTIYNSKPVRWNPCATIHWRFRSTYAPSGALTMVKSAIARVAYLTRTTWHYDGLTTAVPTTKWLPTSTTTIRPVLIGWTDGTASDLLRSQPASVLGVTRTAYFKATVNGTSLAATKAAVIALDRTNKLPMTGSISWRSTLLHEVAHLMGLGHVGLTSQMMYPVLQRSLTDLQYGDRTGLAKVGRSAGCLNLGF